jgi:hypothetical protein
MEAGARRPGGVVDAHEPEGVELLAGRFEGAHDLDGRVVGFGGEDGLLRVAVEEVDEVAPGVEGAVEVEEGNLVEESLPTLQALELGGVGGTRAGPADAVEEDRGEVGEGRGRARGGEDGIGFDGADQGAEMGVKRTQRGRAGSGGAVGGEGPLGREQSGATLAGVRGGDGAMIGHSVGDKSREQEPGDFVFVQRAGDPVQKQERGADGGDAGKRLAEREFPRQERRGLANIFGRGHENTAEDAVDFATLGRDGRHNDADAGGGILKQEIASPRSAGGDFVATMIGDNPGAVGIFGGEGGFGREVGDGDAAGLECGEEVLLGWGDAVEADKKDLGRESEGGAGGEEREQRGLELVGAEPAVTGAFAMKLGGPVAIVLGIRGLVGGTPGLAARGVSIEGGEQGPGLDGKRGHRVR